MKLEDVLKVVDELDIIEIAYIDNNHKSKLFRDFDYHILKETHRFEVQDMLQSKAIMKHEAYDILKDYEVLSITANLVDYDYTVIRITLKIEEA